MHPICYEICNFCKTEKLTSPYPQQQWLTLPKNVSFRRLTHVGTNKRSPHQILKRPLGQTYFFSRSSQHLTIRCSTQKGIFSSYPLINKNCMTQLHIKNIYCYIFIINAVARCENTQSRRDTCCSPPPIHLYGRCQ